MPVSRLHESGLTLVEDSLDARAVEAALQRIDDRLFLTFEIARGQRVYRVLYDRGDQPPAPIADWPHALSSGLVELVQSQRPRGGVDLEASEKANAALKERQLADFDYALDELANDLGPRIAGKRSPAFHRGPHLRRARSGQ